MDEDTKRHKLMIANLVNEFSEIAVKHKAQTLDVWGFAYHMMKTCLPKKEATPPEKWLDTLLLCDEVAINLKDYFIEGRERE